MNGTCYALLVPHPKCGHETVAVFDEPPTAEIIAQEMNAPCAKCTAKYRIAVKRACGHWDETYCDDPAVAKAELEVFRKTPCIKCGAVFIRKNEETA